MVNEVSSCAAFSWVLRLDRSVLTREREGERERFCRLRNARNKLVVTCSRMVECKVCTVQAWTASQPRPVSARKSEPHLGDTHVCAWERPSTQDPQERRSGNSREDSHQRSRRRGCGTPSVSHAAQSSAAFTTPSSPIAVRRPTTRQPRPGQQPRRVFLQCAQYGTDPRAYVGSSDHGLIAHVSQKHGRRLSPRRALPRRDSWTVGLWCVVTSGHDEIATAISVGWTLKDRLRGVQHLAISATAWPPGEPFGWSVTSQAARRSTADSARGPFR